jgi:DNA invertase Pin-like site-specific DNA recombinase
MTSKNPETSIAMTGNVHTPGTARFSKKGYIRVSSQDQNPQLQIDSLLAAGLSEIDLLTDVESGTVRERREYGALCHGIRVGVVHEVWVYRVDRLGRDHYELVSFLQLLEAHDCRLVSVCEPFVEHWQESSWAFRALWEAIGDARYELLRLKERQKDGIRAKKAAVKAGRAVWPGRGPDRQPRKPRGAGRG